jgi:hypothetical protein
MILRVGIPEHHGLLPRVALAHGLPSLVSVGRLWAGGRFKPTGRTIYELRPALDSAGFVAMVRHGGYPWSVAQYLDVVCAPRHDLPGSPWAWWSAMDFCCEPEIAGDAATVRQRVELTAAGLRDCRAEADRRRDMGADISDPMPILQGWHPDDYRRSAELTDAALGGRWPARVGVGSVCRRQVAGPTGLIAVADTIRRVVPRGTALHFFGVKSAALAELSGFDVQDSADSCAWDYAARKQKVGKSSIVDRAEKMVSWYRAQTADRQVQLRLW